MSSGNDTGKFYGPDNVKEFLTDSLEATKEDLSYTNQEIMRLIEKRERLLDILETLEARLDILEEETS